MTVVASEVLTVPSFALDVWLPELVLVGTILLGLIIGGVCGAGCAGRVGHGRSRVGVWSGRAVKLVIFGGLVAAVILAMLDWGPAPTQPAGLHFTVDAMAALVRFAVLLLTALTVLNLPGQAGCRGMVMLVVAALGLVLLAEAATLGGFLLAVSVFIVGASLAAWFYAGAPNRSAVRLWHLTSTLGFLVLAFSAVLWCSLTGAMTVTASLDSLSQWPFLPPLALPVILGMLGVGLALVLLGEPGRFAPGHRESSGTTLPPVVTGWLTSAPPLVLGVLMYRLLHEMQPVQPLTALPGLVTLSAAVLLLGGYLAALTHRNLERRLAWAATGQVGLALLGFSVLVDAGGPATVLPALLAFAAAQFGAMLLVSHRGAFEHLRGACRFLPLLMSSLLLALAALPPLAAWRPRLALLQVLLAGNQHVGISLVILGTLAGCFVYLLPLVDLWRKGPAMGTASGEDGDRFACPMASSGKHTGIVVALLSATLMLAILLAWGAGLSQDIPPVSGRSE